MIKLLRRPPMKLQLHYQKPVQAIGDHRVTLVYRHSVLKSKRRKRKHMNHMMANEKSHSLKLVKQNAENSVNVNYEIFNLIN